MKKVFKFIMNLIIVTLLAGCSPDFDYDGTLGDDVDVNNLGTNASVNSSPYSPPNREIPKDGIIFESEKTGIKAASGIWVNEEHIVVSDREEHKLVILDKEGNRIDEIGKLGSGPLEFSNPTDIYYDEENGYVYILDNDNRRVQILSENLEYINEVSLEDIDIPATMDYLSIIAAKEYIYISTNHAFKDKLYIYRISPDGEMDEIELACSGNLFKSDEDIYIAEMMKYEFTEYEDDPGMFAASGYAGQTYLLKLNGIETEKIAPFPYMYTPSDVIKYRDTYYIASSLWSLVESFKLKEGEFLYEKTLMPQVSPDKVSPNFGYRMALFDNTIYVANYEYGDVYVIELD